jgi:hypothetical protein
MGPITKPKSGIMLRGAEIRDIILFNEFKVLKVAATPKDIEAILKEAKLPTNEDLPARYNINVTTPDGAIRYFRYAKRLVSMQDSNGEYPIKKDDIEISKLFGHQYK